MATADNGVKLDDVLGKINAPDKPAQNPGKNPAAALKDAGGGDSKSTDPKLNFANDFDSFLKLLTTQLQNQNPMKPMDSKKFTSQLVKFSGVEQQIKTNAKLDKLLAQQSQDQSTEKSEAIGYLDKVVQYEGNTVEKQGDTTPLGYRLNAEAKNVTLELTDSQGRVVRRFQPDGTGKGVHEVKWDGTNRQGQQADSGPYTLKVRATKADGSQVDAQALGIGQVKGADFTGKKPQFEVNGQTLTQADFLRVRLGS